MTQVPDDFIFTVKASRYLTHIKRLTEMGQGVERFYATTIGSRKRSASCRPGATASSSASRRGSSTTCTHSCASTAWRS